MTTTRPMTMPAIRPGRLPPLRCWGPDPRGGSAPGGVVAVRVSAVTGLSPPSSGAWTNTGSGYRRGSRVRGQVGRSPVASPSCAQATSGTFEFSVGVALGQRVRSWVEWVFDADQSPWTTSKQSVTRHTAMSDSGLARDIVVDPVLRHVEHERLAYRPVREGGVRSLHREPVVTRSRGGAGQHAVDLQPESWRKAPRRRERVRSLRPEGEDQRRVLRPPVPVG